MYRTSLKTLLLFVYSIFFSFGIYAQSSLFSQYDLYKISVTNEGLYKIDASLLSQMGIENPNPNTISLFGRPGGTLPLSNAVERVEDLAEIPIKWYGDDDNLFESGEYFLFFADGPIPTVYDTDLLRINRPMNPYDLNQYFFVCADKAATKLISKKTYSGGGAILDHYDNYQRYEIDKVNLLGKNFGTEGSGLSWYSDSWANETKQRFEQKFNWQDVNFSEGIDVAVNFVARSENTSRIQLSINDQSKSKSIWSISTSSNYNTFAKGTGHWQNHFDNLNAPPTMELSFFSQTAYFEAWLDYIEVKTKNKLNYDQRPISAFFIEKLNSDFSFQLNTANVEVWDVTNQLEINSLEDVNNSGRFNASQANQAHRYQIFKSSDIEQKPSFIKQVARQNIHSITQADYVLIYHEDVEDQAMQLIAHRELMDGYICHAVNIEEVYNEFSAGMADPTAIRDFMRYIKRHDSDFSYLCLFGDATYDYRQIDPNLPYSNYIPVFQTNTSLNPIEAFPTDDFFALLDDDEGNWQLKGDLDIATGRIPVQTPDEAEIVVNKIVRYETDPSYRGAWKNDMVLVADDEDSNILLSQNEGLYNFVSANYNPLNIKKIYFDAYQQISTIGDPRYPDAKKDLNEAMFQGALIINYFGHGSPKGWAQERVLEIQDILSWNNTTRLPLMITATCSFTPFDDPNITSAGELCLLNEKGGVIGLITTTRAVTIGSNEVLVDNLFNIMFQKSENEYRPLGALLQKSKNKYGNSNDRKFNFIGDPALRLNIPRYNIEIDSFNNMPLDTSRSDTIKALETIHFQGVIKDDNGQFNDEFNGEMSFTLYDKARKITTLANDHTSIARQFEVYNNILFKGSAKVTNGRWSIGFTIPKDIQYHYGNARISMYAQSEMQEASGSNEKFIIGGVNLDGLNDAEPPVISAYLNEISFNNDDVVGPNPILYVMLEDNLGINISNASIGHNIEGILDNGASIYNLNDFYTSAIDAVNRGMVEFPLYNLAEGHHTLLIRAWDINNNPSEITLSFYVEKGKLTEIQDVLIQPNPATDQIRISFTHELNPQNLQIEIPIFAADGSYVQTIQENYTGVGRRVENIQWDLNDRGGGQVSPGLYYFQVYLRSQEVDGSEQQAVSGGGKIMVVH